MQKVQKQKKLQLSNQCVKQWKAKMWLPVSFPMPVHIVAFFVRPPYPGLNLSSLVSWSLAVEGCMVPLSVYMETCCRAAVGLESWIVTVNSACACGSIKHISRPSSSMLGSPAESLSHLPTGGAPGANRSLMLAGVSGHSSTTPLPLLPPRVPGSPGVPLPSACPLLFSGIVASLLHPG